MKLPASSLGLYLGAATKVKTSLGQGYNGSRGPRAREFRLVSESTVIITSPLWFDQLALLSHSCSLPCNAYMIMVHGAFRKKDMCGGSIMRENTNIRNLLSESKSSERHEKAMCMENRIAMDWKVGTS